MCAPRAVVLAIALTVGLITLMAIGRPAAVRADSSITIATSGSVPCSGVAPIACFSPLSISETAGATITWTNSTPEVHTATSCDPQSCAGATSPDVFHTGDIQPGDSASVRLTVPGVYHYFCTLHGYMNGTIT
ncbi:MAG: plastocyanin/azurin family copper-binding protein, partial [Candidatus Dormibacteria bacterium]